MWPSDSKSLIYIKTPFTFKIQVNFSPTHFKGLRIILYVNIFFKHLLIIIKYINFTFSFLIIFTRNKIKIDIFYFFEIIKFMHRIFFILLFLLLPNLVFSSKLNLICTNNYIDAKSLDVKDLFLVIDTQKKKIELGGLIFFPEEIKETESNISWKASDVKIYEDSNGDISGIIGRYSGQLVLNFERYVDAKIISLVFNCQKFQLNEKKF